MMNNIMLIPPKLQSEQDGVAPLWKLWQPVAVLLLANFLSLIPAIAVQITGSGSYNVIGASIISFVIQTGCFCLCPFYIVCIWYKQPPKILGITKLTNKSYYQAVLFGALFYIINVIVSIIVVAFRGNEQMELQAVLQLFDYAINPFEKTALIFCIAVCAPLSEEVLFRAFLYPPLKAAIGRKTAIVCGGILFAACHGSVWVFFPMLAGGICFTALYDKYQNLPMNIMAHMTWNIIALLLFFNV
ncbi:MAG: type II CAAX endopeptidase family protein [Clostridiales bacterium]